MAITIIGYLEYSLTGVEYFFALKRLPGVSKVPFVSST